jgi:TolA-binding protein
VLKRFLISFYLGLTGLFYAQDPIPSHPETGKQQPRFSLAKKYLSHGKYEKTIQVLREILARGETGVAGEQKATYLLGKTFLLQGQTQLAGVSFEHLNKTWPKNPYQSKADFLLIEEKLSQMTNPANLLDSMRKILNFQPFNLDLSFFNYFSGFSLGYNLSDYAPTEAQLLPYFESSDPDLRARALLTHGLIQIFDFDDPEKGIPVLIKVTQSENRFLAHQASFALLLQDCSENLHLPEKLLRQIPKDFSQTEPGLLSRFLYALILAYVHGDFAQARKELTTIKRANIPSFHQALDTHISLLNVLSQPPGSLKLELRKARLYSSHSSYFEALKIYQSLLNRKLTPLLRGKLHYLMARLYQDDLMDPASSSKHLKKARRFNLPPEFLQEIEWREVKNLTGKAREKKILEVARNDLPYTEAAIFRQLRERAINPAFLDKYFQSLLNLGLDPSSQVFYLDQLAQIAEDHHQFLKARYFLMKMARFDLKTARKRLKQTALKEKIYKTKLDAPVSLEPERFQYLQGRYLYLLGKKEAGQKVLESIVKRQSLFAEKAQFELLKHELGATPYKTEKIFELNSWIEKDPDPETKRSAINLLLKHFSTLFKDFEHLESQERDALISDSLNPYLELLKLAENSHKDQREELSQLRLEILFKTAKLAKAKKLLEKLADSPNPVLTHQAQLLALEYEGKFREAASQALDLAGIYAKESPEYLQWFEKSFALATREFSAAGTLQAHFFPLIKTYLEDAQGEARRFLFHKLSAFLGTWPETPPGTKILSRHEAELMEFAPPTFVNTLGQLLKIDPTNADLHLIKLRYLTQYPSPSELTYLYKAIRKGNPSRKLQALLALSSFYQEANPSSIKPTPSLRHALGLRLQNPKSLTAENLESLLELQWYLLDRDSQKLAMMQPSKREPELRSFYRFKALSYALKGKAPEKVLARVLAALDHGGFSETKKLELLSLAFLRLKLSRHAQKLKPWVFKIHPSGLEPEARKKFQTLSRKINAISVIAALQKGIDWDDPQNPKNARPFFEIINLYMNELENFSEAANILNQMHQYFSGSLLRAKIRSLQKQLPLLQQAVYLEQKGNYVSLMEAGEIWLNLQKTARALETYKQASALPLEESQGSFVILQQTRCLIAMNHLQEANQSLKKLPSQMGEMTVELLDQIEATRSINALPRVEKASAKELIQIAKIQLRRFLNLKAADLALKELSKRPQVRSPKLQEEWAWLSLEYYDVSMAQSLPDLAIQRLKKASNLRVKPKTLGRILYTLGTHFTTYDVNWSLAETWLRQASRQKTQTTEGALALLALVSLYETRGQKERALSAISEIKTWLKASHAGPNKNLLEGRELKLRKGLVLSKIQRYIDEMNPGDSSLFLESARALAKNPAYFKEAEHKYLLALRLEPDTEKTLDIYAEMGHLYLEHAKYSQALQKFLKLFSLSEKPTLKFQAGLEAARIQGLKIQNFKGALSLLDDLGKRLPTAKQNQSIKKLRTTIFKRRKSQKKLRLKNLSYNHFPQILDIKQSWYDKRDYTQAALRYEKLLKQSENHQLITGVEYELARLYDLKLKDYKKALEHYQVFLERFDHPQINAEVLLRVAQIQFEEIFEVEAALNSYQIYLRDYPSARKRLAVLFQVAEILVKEKSNYSQALDTYTDISNAYPQTQWDEKAKFARAKLLAKNIGDFEGAIEVYQDLIDHNFESGLAPESQFQIGHILEIQLSDLDRAQSAYEELLARFPQSSFASQARRQLEKIRRR